MVQSTQPLGPILKDLRNGEMILLQDDPCRENEGDLVVAAEHITAEQINFMTRYARGLICVPMTEDQANALKLNRMIPDRRQNVESASFTVSVDADDPGSTGISAEDRANTVRVLVDESSSPEDLRRPGHMFPLIAEDEGVFVRRGQTEGSVDLMKLAGLKPTAVICEVMNQDGTMARNEDLQKFCEQHGIKSCTIQDIARHRAKRESIVRERSRTALPTDHGEFRLRVFSSRLDGCVYSVVYNSEEGPFSSNGRFPPVLLHKKCMMGHVLRATSCNCNALLDGMLQKLQTSEHGAMIVWNGKQSDTAHRSHQPMVRFTENVEQKERRHCVSNGNFNERFICWNAANILSSLNMEQVQLLSNNPDHTAFLREMGMEVAGRRRVEETLLNESYSPADREENREVQ